MLIIVNTPNGRQLQAISNGEVNLLRERVNRHRGRVNQSQTAGSTIFRMGTGFSSVLKKSETVQLFVRCRVYRECVKNRGKKRVSERTNS